MGCGKSKHDVVTANTTKVRKLSEPESVKGKESESIKRQQCCRCRKKNENDTKKSEEREDGGDCGAVEKANDDIKPQTITTFPPVTAIVPENIVTEETVNDIKENVSPANGQKEEINMETVVEEEKSSEDNNDGDVDSKIPSSEVEEPKLDEQTPATESEFQGIPIIEDEESVKENDETASLVNEEITKENDEIAVAETDGNTKENYEIKAAENKEIRKENNEIAASENEEIKKENDEFAATENNEITAMENEETPVLQDNVAVDAVQESPVDITKGVESA